MPITSLRMYDFCPALQAANDGLWQAIRDRLRDAGMAAPDDLDRSGSHEDAWLDPDLLFAQTCGYPLITSLAGKVRLVATPVYDLPGGRGADRCSFLVVRADEPAESLAEMRGRVAAINSRDSNSGHNLFRAAVAPLTTPGEAYFSAVIETGGHMASVAAIRSGRADIAAIDSVSYGLAMRYQPDWLAGLRILGETAYGPGLPFITSLGRTAGEVALLQGAIEAAVGDIRIAEPLALQGLASLDITDYGRLAELEADAFGLDYRDIR